MGVPAGLGRCGFSAVKKQPALQIFKVQAAFFRCAANPSPLPWERVRVRASSGGTNFCSERRRVFPSPTGRRVGLRLPAEAAALEYGGGCRLLFRCGGNLRHGQPPRARVWRHNAMRTVRIRKFIVLKKHMKKQPALRFPTCRLLFCGRFGLCRHRHHLQRIRAAAFAHVRAAGDDVLVAHF